MRRFIDDLRDQLRANAAERFPRQDAEGEQTTRTRGRAPTTRRRRRLVVVALVALAGVAVPALGAVTDLWRPDVRPWPAMRTATVSGRGFSCTTPSRHGIDVGPPIGRAFTSVLGVLARPRTAADAIDRRYLEAPFASGIVVRSIRYLGTAPDQRRYYVIPAWGTGRQSLPERCLHRLPERARRSYEHPSSPSPTICIFGGGGGSCSSLADIRRRGSWGASGVDGRSTVAGVVPNGVRAIHVTYGRSTRVFPVRDNFFAFRVGLDAPRAVRPDRLVWELDDGTVRDVTRHAPRR